jgi:3-dehydroquinate dehydratase-1
MICVSLGKISFKEALEICRKEELVEIRADLTGFTTVQLEELFSISSGIVFTCRKSVFQEDNREEIYRLALKYRVKYIDLDFRTDQDLLEKLRPLLVDTETQLILSIHDFEKTPSTEVLKNQIRTLYDAGAGIAKIACMVNSDEDLSNLIGLYREPGKKIILGMGEKGILTRVAALFMGAEFTFAFPEGGEKTAPGQLTKSDFQEILSIMKS